MDENAIARTARDAVRRLNIPLQLADYKADLEQAAALGAWEALAKADPAKGAPDAYVAKAARHAAQDAIRTELRARGFAVGDTHARPDPAPDAWPNACKRLADRDGIPATTPPATSTVARRRDAVDRDVAKGHRPPPPDAYALADTEGTAKSVLHEIVARDDDAARDLANADLVKRIPRLLNGLRKRERFVIRALYLELWTRSEVAASLRITPQRVGQIERGALAKMRAGA